MKTFVLWISAVFLVPTLIWSQDQISFRAEVSKNKLGVNERLQVDFQMNRDGDNFSPPPFEGFRVIMGPNQSISNSWVNGKRSFSKTYSYILQPTAKGSFTIGQGSVQIDGNTYKTVPIKVEVTEAVAKPNDPNDVSQVLEENLYFEAEISNSNPYVNEPVSIVYKLYFSSNLRIRDFDVLDTPKYTDFWTMDLKLDNYPLEQGVYKGKSLYYYVLKKIVLYPQKSGKLEIKPYSINLVMDVPTNRVDFFGSRIYTQADKTLTAGSRTIEVKSLPEGSKPASFTGAVGDFDFNVSLSKNNLHAGESLQAKVEISGEGNLKLFELPKLVVPSSLEKYEPEFDDKVVTRIDGMQGKVIESYTLVPQYQGKYPIPPVEFSYFNPKTGSYVTLSSKELQVNVIDGPSSGVANTSHAGGAVAKTPVQISGDQFRFIKLNASWRPRHKEAFFNSTLFYILLLGPLLLIPLVLLIVSRRKNLANDFEGIRLREANRLAKRYLSAAKKALNSNEAFYGAMERALHNYLKARLKIETSDMSKEHIASLMESRSVRLDTIGLFMELFESCEFARYAPATREAMNSDYDKAVQVLSQIDKQWR